MIVWDEMSVDARELLFFALDYAMENAQTTAEGFIPFALVAPMEGQGVLKRFAGSDNAAGVDMARRELATAPDDTRAVALAWDGYLTLDDERTEAVFVEAYEVGRERGVLFSQRYERVEGAVRAIGNPLLNTDTDPLCRLN